MKKYYSYIIYLLTSVFVVLLYMNNFGPMENLQKSVNDTLSKFTSNDTNSPNIALVTIDAKSMDKYGKWPWNHDLIADLIAATASGEPKTIVVDFPLNEDVYQDSSGYTQILAEQLSWVKNVVLPYDIALATFRRSKTNNPDYLFNYSIQVNNRLGLMEEESSLLVRKVFLPADKVIEANPYLGFEYIMPDNDRTLRHQSLVMNYEGYYYPSQTLLAAANFLNVKPELIKIYEGSHIDLNDKVQIPINKKSEMYLNFSSGNQFAKYSAAKILDEGFDFKRFKNKLIYICIDDVGLTEFFTTPINPETEKFIIKSTAIDNIISKNLLAEKYDMGLISLLILFGLGGLCAFILPQVSNMYRMIILFAGFMLLANLNYFLFSSFKVIAETVYVALELFLFMLVSPILDSQLINGDESEAGSKKKNLPKFEMDKSLTDSQPVKTKEIFDTEKQEENQQTEMIAKSNRNIDNFNDETPPLLDNNEETEKTTATPISGINTDTDIPPVEDIDNKEIEEDLKIVSTHADSQETNINKEEPIVETSMTPPSGMISNLGRYQITGKLGKGAMGIVYKGIDPAIDRPLALKTIRLDFINDQSEMEDLKERLGREAQAVGKLSHPNIVTIYDVGSEGSLQYIAMEYLEGQTLEDMIKKKTKFNYRIISQIIIQICRALEYAHSKNIVHRDIKPANIMIQNDYQVKVMDFGIARIDSNSMTKTGIAMGTPNYISPEQLQGLDIDNRSDIFSLGVLMYELLLSKRPFNGENITSLIYSILNKEPEKPSNVKPQIPLLFDHIIEKALRKKPSDRYQSASEVISDLAEFVAAFTK
ncbi:MAG: hypothetical protein DRP35_01935 [Candidatus Zixiibacteriota bacterium]|nr:MAG: hypothetical protein DRP35_01935 [candidate division Zixibacteria bacterium]